MIWTVRKSRIYVRAKLSSNCERLTNSLTCLRNLLFNGKKCGAKKCMTLNKDESTSHQSRKQMQKVNCGVYKTTLHCQKNVDRWAKRNEQVRNETEKAQAEMEDTGQKHQAESQVETELDLEIRGLQAGEERRGSNASQ